MIKILFALFILSMVVACTTENTTKTLELEDNNYEIDQVVEQQTTKDTDQQYTEENTMTEKKIIEVSKKGPFKYYQFQAEIVEGVHGEVFLNGQSIWDFDGRGGSTSDNTAQDILKNGKNTISVRLDSIASDVKPDYFTKSVLHIMMHGVQEQEFPSKETAFVLIDWTPKPGQTSAQLEYEFSINR